MAGAELWEGIMRIYSDLEEETLRARRLLREWAAEGFLDKPRQVQLEADLSTDLRQTNGYMRVVLFLFTLGSIWAAVGLYFVGFRGAGTLGGNTFILFSIASWGLAEYTVATRRFYRFGVEEAFVFASVNFFGIAVSSWFIKSYFGPHSGLETVVVPVLLCVACLGAYGRYGFQYAFLGAVLALAYIPYHLSSSHEIQRIILAGFYATGLCGVRWLRRDHQYDFRSEEYETFESIFWLAFYLTLNLQLSSLSFFDRWSGGSHFSDVSRAFYWSTYAFVWFIPILALGLSLREKNRGLIGFGVVMMLLTLVTNKPYLGWPRHEWDPMILGFFLITVVMLIRRRLASGPNGVLNGFTARRILSSDKRIMDILGGASGLMSPGYGLSPSAGQPHPGLGGGQSGGGGASSSF